MIRLITLVACVAALAMTFGCAHPSADQLRDVPIGSCVCIEESGVPADYIVVEKGPGAQSATLLRKEVLPEWRRFSDYSSYYPNSDIDAYLEGAYLESLSVKDWAIDSEITVSSRDAIGLAGAETEKVSRKAYLLSCSEAGFDAGYAIPSEGEPLSYFKGLPADGRASSDHDTWFFRTPNTLYDSAVYVLDATGKLSFVNASDERGIRPAICVDGSVKVGNSEGGDAYYVE